MTMRDEFSNRINDGYKPLSFDEITLLMEQGRRMRSRAMHDYLVGLFGVLRRSFDRRPRGTAESQPLKARHA